MKNQKGQSLVEVAIFFPIFLIILAGVVEVSQLIVTKNRVTEATRSGARFGSNGGENQGITTVTLNTVTQTLGVDPETWDIWIVRGMVNQFGNGFDEWSFEHNYGLAHTYNFSDVNESEIQIEVLEQLQLNQSGQTVVSSAQGLRFVGVYAIHDVKSILGLLEWGGYHSVHELSIMRFIGIDQVVTEGCSVFPLGVPEGIRSVSPPNTPPVPFPDNFESYPPDYGDFIYHKKDMPLELAGEGYVYIIPTSYLMWGYDTDWIESMTWAGNSELYIEPDDTTDTEIHKHDWIRGVDLVPTDDMREILNNHITAQRGLLLPIYSQYDGNYLVSDFAVFKIQGYNLVEGWILVEFIRFDRSCGQ